MKKPTLIPAFLLLALALCADVHGQGRINWQAADASGAERSQEGLIRVYSNVGQSVNGVTTGTGRILNSGYLYVRLVPTGVATISTQSLIDFGSVLVGQTETRSLTVQNTGALPLNISGTPATPSQFTVIANGGAQTIAPGGSVTMQLQFAPSAAGLLAGTLTINSNAGNDPSFDVTLRGTGTASAPNLQLSTTSLPFNATVGGTDTRSVTLSNTGNAPLNLSGQAISGPNASLFTITHNAASPIAGGGSDFIEVRYAPTSAGNHAATLTITSNDPNTPTAIVNLNGNATTGNTPRLTMSTSPIDFGTTTPSTLVTRILVISNTGTAQLTLNSQNVSGTGFSLQAGASGVIDPGGTTTATLAFQPSAVGSYSGTYSLTSNDPANPSVSVTLNGQCSAVSTGPRIAASRSYIDFTPVKTGVQKVEDVVIRNTGNQDLVISQQLITGIDAADFSIVSPATTTIAPGGSATVRLGCRPFTAGNKRANYSVESNDPTQRTFDLALIATATGVSDPAALPRSIRLHQNYPNPFNPGTTFRFETDVAGVVELRAYTMYGEDIGIINSEFREAGTHSIQYDGSMLASGVYSIECRLIRGNTVERSNVIQITLAK